MKTYPVNEKSEMIKIIDACQMCFVGFSNHEGFPYVVPMNFAMVEDDIILHSGPEGTHLSLLSKDENRVCVTFCTDGRLVYQHKEVACSYRMDAKSVMCRGYVEFVEDLVEKERLLNIFMKKYTDKSFTYSEPALKNVKLWKVRIVEMTGKEFGQKHRKHN